MVTNKFPTPKRAMRILLDMRNDKDIDLVLAAKHKVGLGFFTKYIIDLIRKDMASDSLKK